MAKIGWKLKLAVFIAIYLLVLDVAESNSRSPRKDDEQSTSDALKYLQALDSFYSNNARPRNTRNDVTLREPEARDLETAIHLLRLNTIDRTYSSHNRPRFGKRSGFYKIMRDKPVDDDDMEDWQNFFFGSN